MNLWPADRLTQMTGVFCIVLCFVSALSLRFWGALSPKVSDWAATFSIACRRRRIIALTEELERTERLLQRTYYPFQQALIYGAVAMLVFLFGVMVEEFVLSFPPPSSTKTISSGAILLFASTMSINLAAVIHRETLKKNYFHWYKADILARIKKLEEGLFLEKDKS